MSYILDALKKSEEKRGTFAQPAGQVMMVSEKPSGARRIILPLLFALLAVTAGWLLAQWQAADTDKASLAKQAAEGVASKQPPIVLADMPVDHMMVNDSTTSIVASQPQNYPAHSAQHTIVAAQPVEQRRPVFAPITPASALNRLDVSTPHQDTDQPQALDTTTVKSIFELSQNQQQAMPKIKIEAHLYDDDPRSRMVIINGKVRREKQTIGAGLVLQEITPDGVLLHYQGSVYHMGVFD